LLHEQHAAVFWVTGWSTANSSGDREDTRELLRLLIKAEAAVDRHTFVRAARDTCEAAISELV
jgi:hypothetical protein